MIRLHTDASKLGRRVRRLKTFSEKIRDDARLAAGQSSYFHHQYTLPASRNNTGWDATVAKLRDRIEDDVKFAFPVMGDDGWESSVFPLIKAQLGDDKANEFWRAYKERDQRFDMETGAFHASAETVFQKMRVTRRIDGTAYAALRRGSPLKIPRNNIPLASPNQAARASFIRQRKQTAGLAKAGWFGAYKSIGYSRLQVSRGATKPRTWPKEVRSVARRFGEASIGRSQFSVSRGIAKFTIVNSVRYADSAMPEHLRSRALGLTQRAMSIIMRQRLKYAIIKSNAA